MSEFLAIMALAGALIGIAVGAAYAGQHVGKPLHPSPKCPAQVSKS